MLEASRVEHRKHIRHGRGCLVRCHARLPGDPVLRTLAQAVRLGVGWTVKQGLTFHPVTAWDAAELRLHSR
jgi:hypothetical protein